MTKDWRPDGWQGWSREQRRIWRLEQQLLRWEALGFAARDLAHELATEVAQLKGEAVPTVNDMDGLLFRKARSRWNLSGDGPDSLEIESQKKVDIEEDAG